jgi:hypothetical protein
MEKVLSVLQICIERVVLGDPNQNIAHAKQALYHWITFLA